MHQPLTRSKKIIFTLLTTLLVLVVLELGARVTEAVVERLGNGREASPFVSYQNMRDVFTVNNLGGIDYYVRTDYHPYILSDLRFRAVKPGNTFRVFCLGGSAALGWPHLPAQSYPAFLAKKLQLLYPDKEFEIINVAASTYASYRVKTIFDEIIHYQPDLILLYTGNNEFLERILYQPTLEAPWSYSALARTVHQGYQHFGPDKQIIDLENYRPTFLIDVALGNTSALKVSEEQFHQVVDHYRYNLTEMINSAQQNSVPIMLLTVPVNVRDWSPHASVHRAELDSAGQQQWQHRFAPGFRAFHNQRYEAALLHFQSALDIDDTHAELQYLTGKSYEHLSKPALSRTHLLSSLEADAYPFRALPQFNHLLRNLSQDYGVPLADIEQMLTSRAAMGVIGEDLLVDHVHPTVASNQLIADEVLSTLWQKEILPAREGIDLSSVRLPVPPQAEATLPLMQHLFLIYRVLLQFDKMDNLYQRCTELPDYEKNTFQYREFMMQFDRYLEVMRPYQQLLIAQKTGQVEEEFGPEEIATIVEDYVSLSKQSLAVNMSEAEVRAFVPVEKR
jgi:lysophospholipase L1-like esterase